MVVNLHFMFVFNYDSLIIEEDRLLKLILNDNITIYCSLLLVQPKIVFIYLNFQFILELIFQ